jgi:oligoribonuclease (3'-5' exoribonuclease)
MKLYSDIFKGGIIDAGIALVQKEASRHKQEMDRLRQENHQQKELLDKFKESTTTVNTLKDSNQDVNTTNI